MNVENKCAVCGETIEEGFDLCEKHLDDAMVLLTAIMKAMSVDDVVVAWTTWRCGEGRTTTTFLDNCQNCGRLMWIARWERTNGRHGGQYCSRECKAEASKRTKERDNTVVTVNTPTIPSRASSPTKNPDAVALGTLGGLKGGVARAQKLSPERRTEIASNAVKTRWAKQDKPGGLTTNSKCPKCGSRTLERDDTDLHCWTCGHTSYYVFSEN